MPRFVALLFLSLACTDAAAPDLGGMPRDSIQLSGDVVVSARSEHRADSLQFFVSIKNQGTTAARMKYGDCSFGIRGVTSSGAVWDNRLPQFVGCSDVLNVLDVNPGEQVERRVWWVRESDVRPAGTGTFVITVFMRIDGVLREFPAGSVRL